MKWIIYACGTYSLLFAIFHILFWKILRWKKDLQKLTSINAAVMQILNVQLIWIFIGMSFLCFCFPIELTGTSLGKSILGISSLFWVIRLVQQPIFIKKNDYRKQILTVVFILGAVLFALPLFVS